MSNQACQTCKTVYTDEQKGGYTYRMQGEIIYCRVCPPNATPNDPKAIFDLCWSNGDEMAFLDEESLNVLIETLRECLTRVLICARTLFKRVKEHNHVNPNRI